MPCKSYPNFVKPVTGPAVVRPQLLPDVFQKDSGRSHNTDWNQCLLDIDMFDRARSTLGPTAEIVSRLLPGSLTECWLMTVGLLLSITQKQTSKGRVFPIIPRG